VLPPAGAKSEEEEMLGRVGWRWQWVVDDYTFLQRNAQTQHNNEGGIRNCVFKANGS
jgi:hypothetical protein